jgi:hypothetical protein
MIALNPDTFSSERTKQEDRTKFCEGAITWINPILEPSLSRTSWEEARRTAMNEGPEQFSAEELALDKGRSYKGNLLSSEWNQAHEGKENY